MCTCIHQLAPETATRIDVLRTPTELHIHIYLPCDHHCKYATAFPRAEIETLLGGAEGNPIAQYITVGVWLSIHLRTALLDAMPNHTESCTATVRQHLIRDANAVTATVCATSWT